MARAPILSRAARVREKKNKEKRNLHRKAYIYIYMYIPIVIRSEREIGADSDSLGKCGFGKCTRGLDGALFRSVIVGAAPRGG